MRDSEGENTAILSEPFIDVLIGLRPRYPSFTYENIQIAINYVNNYGAKAPPAATEMVSMLLDVYDNVAAKCRWFKARYNVEYELEKEIGAENANCFVLESLSRALKPMPHEVDEREFLKMETMRLDSCADVYNKFRKLVKDVNQLKPEYVYALNVKMNLPVTVNRGLDATMIPVLEEHYGGFDFLVDNEKFHDELNKALEGIDRDSVQGFQVILNHQYDGHCYKLREDGYEAAFKNIAAFDSRVNQLYEFFEAAKKAILEIDPEAVTKPESQTPPDRVSRITDVGKLIELSARLNEMAQQFKLGRA